MSRRLTAIHSKALEGVEVSEFDFGEGPAGLRASWETKASLEDVVDAVNDDRVFPSYRLEEVREGTAEQVGVYHGDGFTDYTFNSSDYHIQFREKDLDWKGSEVDFLQIGEQSYEEEISAYYSRL
ncbi:hypothetical protein AQV86_05475 [Nanohaloarchaea archaeon SG9]|nr:hypothetical protein AQV86_05475 [Nanohaloarchaea archaeon SG9]